MSTMTTQATWPDLEGFTSASQKARHYIERTWMTRPDHIGNYAYRVWTHDTNDGHRLVGLFDRAMPSVRDGVPGVLLLSGAHRQKFMPDCDIAAFDLRRRR